MAKSDETAGRIDALAELQAGQACVRLLMRYFRLIDDGRASRVVDLFTTDAQWRLGETNANGSSEIGAFFTARERMVTKTSRHALTNIDIEVIEGAAHGEAVGRAYLVAYLKDVAVEADPATRLTPVMVGDVAARFVRIDGVWAISEMTTTGVISKG